MNGRTPSPYGKSPTPTPKKNTVTPYYSPISRVASRRVPMERSPTPIKKRCPNGSRKNKKGICVKRGSRCPNGTRKNRKTGKCESKKN